MYVRAFSDISAVSFLTSVRMTPFNSYQGHATMQCGRLTNSSMQVCLSDRQPIKIEPRHEKTSILHMRGQRRRSASW